MEGAVYGAAAGARPTSGDGPRPRGPPARAGPLLPSFCPLSAAATAAAKANATAAPAAATTAALLGARRGLMLSSAASPPFWAPGAATILHILAPSPSLPRPRLAGSGHAPFPSRDGARRWQRSCFLGRAGAKRAGAADNTLKCQSGVAAKSPPHPPGRPRDWRHRRGPAPAERRRPGLLT